MFRGELSKAEKEFEKLIGKFGLMENYADNFDGLHKNNKESVFEVQFSGNQEGGHAEYNLLQSTSHHSAHTMEDMRRLILQIGFSRY